MINMDENIRSECSCSQLLLFCSFMHTFVKLFFFSLILYV